MSRTHEYHYFDDEIPSFDWHEKGEKVEHTIPIGGSILLHFAEGRIVGVEIYDTRHPIHIAESFQDEGEIEVETAEEIESRDNSDKGDES